MRFAARSVNWGRLLVSGGVVVLAALLLVCGGESQQAKELPSVSKSETEGWQPRGKTEALKSKPMPPSDREGWQTPPLKSDPKMRPARHDVPDGPPLIPKKKVDEAPELKRPDLLPPIKIEDPRNKNQPEPIPTLPTPLPLEPRKSLDGLDEREVLLAAARNAVRQKNWDYAVARFEEYFRKYGDNFEIRLEYLGVLVQAGRSRDALREYLALIARKPDDAKLRIQAGDLAVYQRDYLLAISQFQRAVELAPDDANAAVRLARALGFDGDFVRSWLEYDRSLAKFQPGEDDVPRTLPNLLVDLGRPAEALQFLVGLLKREPDDSELLTASARAYAKLGDRAKALQDIDKLAEQATRNAAALRELADAFYGSEDFELALSAYSHLLKLKPNDPLALIGSARVQMKLFQPLAARMMLDSLRSVPPTERPPEGSVRLSCIAQAELHTLVGEYTEAKQIYHDLLAKDEKDHEVRLALASLYEFQREDEKAKAEYGKIPFNGGLGRRGRLGIASTLTTQRRFAEALEIAKQAMAEGFADGAAAGQLVRTLAKWGKPGEAANEGKAFLAAHPRIESARIAIGLAVGRALMDDHRNQEAIRVYNTLICPPAGMIAEAHYGLARAMDRAGDEIRAQKVLIAFNTIPGRETRNRLLVADLFSGDFDDERAAELAGSVAKVEPENLAALIRLGDMQMRLAQPSADIRAALATGRLIQEVSPTNVRAALAIARAYTIVQDWKSSAKEYHRLISQDPDFIVPQRELGRCLYAANDFAGGAAAYKHAMHPSPDATFHAALSTLAHKDPRCRMALGPCLAINGPGRLLKTEVAKAMSYLGDPDLSWAVHRAALDFDARFAECTTIQLESEVKDTSWKPYETIAKSKALLDIEPSNTSTWFDLGQACSSLKQTIPAIDSYSGLLRIDPRDRQASIATERAGYELNPQFNPYVNFFRQRGRDGLAQIERTTYGMFARIPCRNEDEYFVLGYSRNNYRPTGDPQLQGNILSAGGQGYPDDRLFLYGLFNYEDYPDRFSDRITFDVGSRYDCSDIWKLRTGIYLNNVAENGESIQQNIYRNGFRLGADYKPARRWEFNGTYTYGHYSDDNDYNELFLQGAFTMCFAPQQLKFVLSSDIYGYREQTIRPNQNNLNGAVHPYFSPDFFCYYEGRIEWTQWISRDYFAHSNQCWYSLQYGLGWDNSFNNYNNFRIIVNFDLKPWLSIGADGRAQLSDVYDSAGIFAYVIVRMPFSIW